MEYDVVIVPGCETLRSSTLERLEAFRNAGGRLIFLGNAPELENAVASERGKALYERSEKILFAETALLNALDDVRLLDLRLENSSQKLPVGSRVNNLLHQFRQDDGCKWLFLAHADEPSSPDVSNYQDIKIVLSGIYTPTLYNTLNGAIEAIPFEYENGKTIIRTRMYDYDSLLLQLKE